MVHTYAFLLAAAYILPIWSSPVDSVALAPTAKLRRNARQDKLDVLTKEFRVSIGTRPMMNVPRIDLPSWKKLLGWHRNTWKMYCCLRPTIPTVKVLQILLLGTCSSSNLAKATKDDWTSTYKDRFDSIWHNMKKASSFPYKGYKDGQKRPAEKWRLAYHCDGIGPNEHNCDNEPNLYQNIWILDWCGIGPHTPKSRTSQVQAGL